MRPIADPCHLFLIDVSYSSAITGLLHVAVQSVRNCLDAIAANPRARVGVITFDAQLQVCACVRVCVCVCVRVCVVWCLRWHFGCVFGLGN